MPTINANKNIVLGILGREISDRELEKAIPMLGTDLEKITDDKIVVEIFPNRPDLLSSAGLARALSSFLDIKTGLKRYKVNKSGYAVIVDKKVEKVRPYTVCAVIKGIDMTEDILQEIIDLQEKLHITYGRNRKKLAVGIYPLDKISWPVRYTAEDKDKIRFIPLDCDREMTGVEILDKHEKGREYAYLLAGMDTFPLFIDSDDNILSMPPIINSEKTGKVTRSTKDLFIECSGFDLNSLNKALNMIVSALSDLGGDIYEVEIRHKGRIRTPILSPEEINISKEYVNEILGIRLDDKELKKRLEKMGFGYSKGKVFIPPYRTDILHQIDIVEDIAISHGYDNFKGEILPLPAAAEKDKFGVFCERIRDVLAGCGLIEVKNYTLIGEEEQTTDMYVEYTPIRLKDSISDYDTIRFWITPSLIKTLSNNQHNSYPQNIFEIGRCMNSKLEEFDRLGVVICHERSTFTEAKQIIDNFFDALGISYDIRETDHGSYVPGRVGRISIKKRDIAYIGEIHPAVLEKWNLPMPVSSFEINLTELFKIISRHKDI